MVVKDYDFSFVFIESEEVCVHPGLDIMNTIEEWLEWVIRVGFEGKIYLHVISIAMKGHIVFS